MFGNKFRDGHGTSVPISAWFSVYLVKAVREITDTMLAVNAAVNFVIYVVFNRGFRDRLGSQLCCRQTVSTYESTTSRRVLQRGSRSCCWCCRRRSPPRLVTNDVEMMSQPGITMTGDGVATARKFRGHRRHQLGAQTDL